MKTVLTIFVTTASCTTGLQTAACAPPKKGETPKPNIIVILTDDQGYTDVGCYGAHGFRTPNADRMAREGMRFTDFYAASSLSTPSRAALLTGCYAQRVGMSAVLFPDARSGMNPSEETLGSMLQEAGYATACVGKWHLGHQPEALPLQHGFDEFFGLPYSNDMCPALYPGLMVPNNHDRAEYPPLPLIHGNEIIEQNPLMNELTTRYTEYAVDYIRRKKDGPFFLYLAHSMPHVPLAVSDKFRGKSHQGLYGDVIMEIDWSIGRIYEALAENGIADHTLVIYTSDNGPWLQMGNHGGCADPFRLGKGNTFEGGQRVFCLATWPGVIPAGSVCMEITSTIDMMPTFAHIAGGKLPERTIDGKNIYPLLSGQKDAVSPREAFYFYSGNTLHAIRVGDWKYHVTHPYGQTAVAGRDGFRGSTQRLITPAALFNLREDIREEHNLIDRFPERVANMKKMLEEFDLELKANIRRNVQY
jgi:arylsulfatase